MNGAGTNHARIGLSLVSAEFNPAGVSGSGEAPGVEQKVRAGKGTYHHGKSCPIRQGNHFPGFILGGLDSVHRLSL